MAFLIGGANSAADTGYDIENSLRCNGTDSYLTFTLGTPTSQRIATFSAWGKFMGQRSGSNDNSFWSFGNDYGQAIDIVRTNGTVTVYIDDSDQVYLNFNNGPYLRDPSAWYHLFVQIDTTQGTATNRMKFYLNGTQLDNTTASHENQPDEDYDIPGLASGQVMGMAARNGTAHFIDGYIAEMIYLDGTVGAISDFGETDEDSGIWKPKKYTAGNFGNNGAWLEFKQSGTGADASGIGADTSGNTNHFTIDSDESITVFQTTDSPTNNFCTFNPISIGLGTLLEGNTQFDHDNGDAAVFGTMGMTNGKWYWEVKGLGADNGGVQKWTPGIIGSEDHFEYNNHDGGFAPEATSVYLGNGNVYENNSSVSSDYDTAVQNDIISIAVDMDNLKIYFAKNGTWMNSGDPTSGATGTGAVALTASFAPYIPIFGEGSGAEISFAVNFGNPSFSISSSQADDNGYGNFEYDVPTGFYALCTKNLAEFG